MPCEDYIKLLEDHIESLEQRLRHLFESKYIRSFDLKDYKTGKYKRDILEIDKLIDRAVKSKDGINQDIWISVDDELPPMRELVLCCEEKGGMFLGKYAGNSSLDDKPVVYTQSRTSRVLKFWCPLPKPPGGVKMPQNKYKLNKGGVIHTNKKKRELSPGEVLISLKKWEKMQNMWKGVEEDDDKIRA